MKIILKIISVFFALILILLFVVSIFYQSALIGFFQAKMKTYGFSSLFIASFILESVPQYVAPQLLVFVAAFLKFPFFETVLFLYLGSLSGSIISFEIGKQWKKQILSGFFNKNRQIKTHDFMGNRGKWWVLLTSISPLPYLPLVFGALNLSRKKFIIYTKRNKLGQLLW